MRPSYSDISDVFNFILWYIWCNEIMRPPISDFDRFRPENTASKYLGPHLAANEIGGHMFSNLYILVHFHRYAMTRSYVHHDVQHYAFICVTWHIPACDVNYFPQKSPVISGSFAEMTCNLRHNVSLRHPVTDCTQCFHVCIRIWKFPLCSNMENMGVCVWVRVCVHAHVCAQHLTEIWIAWNQERRPCCFSRALWSLVPSPSDMV